MEVINSIKKWQEIRKNINGQTIGFVATMGALHLGHGSLVSICRQENDVTVASIFINPTQFNQQQDFVNYPKNLAKDIEYFASIGVDYCITPRENDVYPEGFLYKIQEEKHANLMEGELRPGHFSGMLTVVIKLLNLVQPHNAYFGEKDYQQYLLIKNMVADFFMPINIKACPIVREKSGLALSSRNTRLTPEGLELANKFAQIFQQNIELSQIKKQLLALGITVEYLQTYQQRKFIAVSIDGVRLIDNRPLLSSSNHD